MQKNDFEKNILKLKNNFEKKKEKSNGKCKKA